jgi:hypothetical protein
LSKKKNRWGCLSQRETSQKPLLHASIRVFNSIRPELKLTLFAYYAARDILFRDYMPISIHANVTGLWQKVAESLTNHSLWNRNPGAISIKRKEPTYEEDIGFDFNPDRSGGVHRASAELWNR